ncbi:hypothetical protein [Desulforamulus hydrothermalis]|uniref:Stage III sporulation protein AG n=1 Tax=Desulforamulus hydrothermalis Lam5 = DSM 18033 TaxID=1121428 RepID=K8EK45_9FIRM|nr:hypothetical protein [Desulforamulus hydrothermalis]CCO08911.1 conserved exported hypothetical protein [Desulforamulus hydrothermalis Lam5 = DSM 18033]SHG74586.1 stage III sporulation protein AG [Desulforamulus hydrothermalis Lam5 = DSM 18033]
MSWFKNLIRDGETGEPKKELIRKLKLLAAAAALGVALILLGGLGGKADQTVPPAAREQTAERATDPVPVKTAMASEEEYLSQRLCQMLEQVEGAGKVKVTVRLQNSTRTEYAVNTSTGKKTTQEKDQSGGTRVLTEDTDTGQLVLVTRNGEQTPVLSREVAPAVAGVLVVADGAGDPAVKARLFRATQVALGVEPQKVVVMARKAGE